MNSDNDRWRLPAAYIDALGHDDADFAWELVRRTDEFKQDYADGQAHDRLGEALGPWGLTFRAGSVRAGGSGCAGLLGP